MKSLDQEIQRGKLEFTKWWPSVRSGLVSRLEGKDFPTMKDIERYTKKAFIAGWLMRSTDRPPPEEWR